MNSSAHIFTRSRKGIDTRVWLTLITVAVVSVGLLGYKVASDVNCSFFEISVKGYTAGKANSYYLGEELSFATQMPGAKSIVWDFGDRTKAEGPTVKHSYKSEGTFMVTATINGKCSESISISIRQLTHQPVTMSATMENPISGPEVIHAGEPVNFTCAATAGTYEWTVLNAPDFPVQSANVATFVFPAPGTRIIELKLDNDAAKVFRKNIQVLPPLEKADATFQNNNMTQPVLPPPAQNDDDKKDAKEPEAPKSVVIPNEEFVNLLNQATEGKKDVQAFSQFLCNGGQTKVLVNGTEWETLGSFHQKIYGKKKFDIKSVETVRDEHNCVTILKVKYKKRALGIF